MRPNQLIDDNLSKAEVIIDDDSYYADGLRLVLFLTDDDIAYDRLHWYDWEVPSVDKDIGEGDTK